MRKNPKNAAAPPRLWTPAPMRLPKAAPSHLLRTHPRYCTRSHCKTVKGRAPPPPCRARRARRLPRLGLAHAQKAARVRTPREPSLSNSQVNEVTGHHGEVEHLLLGFAHWTQRACHASFLAFAIKSPRSCLRRLIGRRFLLHTTSRSFRGPNCHKTNELPRPMSYVLVALYVCAKIP